MKIEKELDYFNLDKNYKEEDLLKAYEEKKKELEINFDILKSLLKETDTIKYKKESLKKIDDTIKKIVISPNIDEHMAKNLFIFIKYIKQQIEKNTFDLTLISYLTQLKYDGSKEDGILLYLISQGIRPDDKKRSLEFLNETPLKK